MERPGRRMESRDPLIPRRALRAGLCVLAGAVLWTPPGAPPERSRAAWAQSRPVGPPFFERSGKKKGRKPKGKRRRRRSAESRPASRPGAAATQPASRPALTVVWPKEDLDLRAERAVRRGLSFLYRAQKPDGSWDSRYAQQHPGGVESLAVLAALSAGEDPKHPKLAAALAYLQPLEPRTVYVRAVRAMLYARLGGADYADRLQEDATWLARYQLRSGGWGYGPGYRTTRDNPMWTDVSNTFLAIRALRDAEAAGAKVPPNTWSRCRFYWSRVANADGGISYQPTGTTGFRLRASSYGSMTAAGISALGILSDRWAALDEPNFATTGPRRANPSPYQKTLDGALKWLAANLDVERNPKWVWGAGEAYEYYYLYVLQHVAGEVGRGRLGGRDFVRESADAICSRQGPDGNWCDPQLQPGADDDLLVIRTCFALLALVRARGPVVVHRLALADGPPNDPRDAANLTRWIARRFRWSAGWRHVTLDTPDDVLRRAPLLYVHAAAKQFPPPLGPKLRAFVAAGGTLVVQPFAGEAQTVTAAKDYLVPLFPEYQPIDVPDSHPVYSLYFKVPLAGRPKLFGLGDGCRTRVFLFASDVSGAWHQDRAEQHPGLFQLGANLLLYTTDLAPPVGQLRAGAKRAEGPKPFRSLKLARLRHGGDWNVCPGALRRLGDVLNEAVSLGVAEAPAVDPTEAVDHGIALLWLTGTRPPVLLPSQKTGLKAYLEAGGMLLVDSAMGDEAFTRKAIGLLTDLFGPGAVRELPGDHPLLTGSFAGGMGSDVTRVAYTRAAKADHGEGKAPTLMGVVLNGRVAAVLSPVSVTGPLAGHPIYGCKGLSGPDAARLAANVVLYAATRRPGGGT